MKASVIIPTFNRSSLLVKCVDSWISQSFPAENYEIIVVDNNSIDNTKIALDSYIKKYMNIKYVKEERAGLVFARHAGANIANSDKLIFADDDGIYNPTCLQEIINVYNGNPDVVAVGGKIDICWDGSPPEWVIPYEGLLGKLNYGNEVVISNSLYINGGLFSIKRNILYEVNGFNPDQIGDYLVGDGEVGLCNKLHQKNYLIAWTPYAEMQHLQFININATIKDIGRRFYNNGICHSYNKFKSHRFMFNKSLVKYILRSIVDVLKTSLKYSFLSASKESKSNYFKLMHIYGRFMFLIYLISSHFRRMIKSNNWF